MSITLRFEDASIVTSNYFTNGSESYPKEMVEIFSEGRVVCLENFRNTSGVGFRSFKSLKDWRQDKGHSREFTTFLDRVKHGGHRSSFFLSW